jgi:hypothetical protein
VVVEDLNNLAAALADNPDGEHRATFMVHVVAHAYPMRDHLVARLKAARDVGAFVDANLPLAPDPHGGPVESAYGLASELAFGHRVPQAMLELRLADVPASVQRTFGIPATAQGLRRLIRRVFGRDVAIVERSAELHATEYRLDGTSGGLDTFGLALPVHHSRRDGTVIGFLSRADHGLTYVGGTRHVFDNRVFAIRSVDADRIIAEPDAIESGYRPAYTFARNYVLPLGDGAAVEDLPKLRDRGGALLDARMRLRGDAERRTVALIRRDEVRSAAGDPVPVWNHDLQPVTMAIRNAAVMVASLAVPEAVAPERHARVAFTLAATLNDLLFSLFPVVGFRLVAMSPHAAPAIDAAAAAGAVDVLRRYPRLTAADAAGRLDAPPLPIEAWSGSLAAFVDTQHIDRADAAFKRRRAPMIDLVVLEDCDHDLGVVRRIFEDFEILVDRWLGYCAALAADPKGAGVAAHYRFGTGAIPAVFDFIGATDVLKGLSIEGRSS